MKTFSSDNSQTPSLDREKIKQFFEGRADKIKVIGPVSAVIYQDKNPLLALERDKHEKECLLPKMKLNGSQRFLDLGCGSGRWTNAVKNDIAYYHGVDLSKGLIEYAKTQFVDDDRIIFSEIPVEDATLSSLEEDSTFEVVLCSGVIIYLNDDDLSVFLNNACAMVSPGGKFVIREPVSVLERLTLSDHFSEDLEADYNATYRNIDSLKQILKDHLSGFSLHDCGFLYDSRPELENRKDTRQYYWIYTKDS